MQYRDFGQLAFKPSALGFGAMRLPVLLDDEGKPDFRRIDYPLATEMLHRAVDGGVNYVDTAWMYHEDNCEAWLGEALKGGYRERVQLATKMPVWNVEKPSDFDRILGIQLQRLQTDTIDYYLLHSLDEAHWKCVVEQDQLASAERALADGRIGHLGFSFHGAYEDFEAILAATDLWEFVQIQYNYMDEDYQAGRKGLELAAGKGLGVIVMEPVRGGALARNVPPGVQAVWDEAPVKRSPAEWALQWVWSHPEVSFLLSGMNTMEQVEQNLQYADRSRADLLTGEELALVVRVRELYRELRPIPCTSCRYCMP
jgi:predicted aldo/keto reductase-like oxidoreductase